MSEQALLTTSGLTMRFGGVVAVDGVDFAVKNGELRCLIGPNGAGKSTFFKCLTGQLRPTAGSVRFADQELGGQSTHTIVRQGIGIKTQVPNLFDGLPARENIALSARQNHSQKQSEEITDQMLELIAITALASREVGRLAHGERQLVELAMVLAARPRLVLLDEPAAGMTAEERGRLATVLRALAGDMSLIVVEHDMQFIRDIATEITVLHRGRVFIEGDVAEIMAHREVQEIYLGKEANGAA
ncbi:MAG: ABC transporter ATP-binding protein [Rhodospirillales bacterium]|jgi:branched-chain amino acid transport system ATP-binding protein/urea transport system ATP-binding protein|nr:ABC transporter ATP-binding protein [Rhodospirillales bacterium]MDP7228179.1 ABC transporter ATP-binding protein [Alphaproteobacteria bacterium]